MVDGSPPQRTRFSLLTFVITLLFHEGMNVLFALAAFGSAMSAFAPSNHAEQDVAFWNWVSWVWDFLPLWLEKEFPPLSQWHFGLLHVWSFTVAVCCGFLAPLIFSSAKMVVERKQDALRKSTEPREDPY